MKNVLQSVIIDPERIKVKASKLLNTVGDLKRSGAKMLTLMTNQIIFKPGNELILTTIYNMFNERAVYASVL